MKLGDFQSTPKAKVEFATGKFYGCPSKEHLTLCEIPGQKDCQSWRVTHD